MPCIDIKIEDSINMKNSLFIDLRSPLEWLDGNIPGSINIPIFNDQERADIGTRYKIDSEQAAELGLEIAAPKLPTITRKIKKLADTHSIIVYCWRGGMRSKSVSTILELLGIEVLRLEGGYRSYRNYIVEKINEVNYQVPFLVLQGMTGVGKTIVLERLQQQGYPVLNLEQLAGHRGSIFGAIGLQSMNKQKQFDALYWERIKEIGDTSYYIIEAESKRIGKVTLPDNLLEAKSKGIHVLIEAPSEIRINRLYEEYVQNNSADLLKEELLHPIEFLKKKLKVSSYQKLIKSIEDEDYYVTIQILMEEYYDPLYIHSFNQYEGQFHMIDAFDIDLAVGDIKILINNLLL